MSAANRYN